MSQRTDWIGANRSNLGGACQSIELTALHKITPLLGVLHAASSCHDYIGTEHILLALLQGQSGVAFSVLAGLGVTYSVVLNMVVRDLGVRP
jgi:hypothetical protein